MAPLVATAAAPLVVAPIQRLIEMASDATIGAFWEEIQLIWGVNQEKERLVSMLKTISMVLEDKDHPKHGLVQSWHDQLSEVVYDAEDVLDEFATEAELLSRRKKYSPQKLVRKLRCKRHVAHELNSIWNRLDNIVSKNLGVQMTLDIREPRHVPQDISNVHEPTAGYIPFQEKLVPREQGREKIMNWLCDTVDIKNGEDMNVSLFSVFGLGGMGKTTLAQSVYSDSRVKELFQTRMWVCVSNDFNITRITKEMMTSPDHSGGCGYANVDNLDTLQRRVEAKLEGKKVLLVLDDVWELTPGWKILLNPLRGVTKGSKVLVTTRDKNIAGVMTGKEKNMLHLKGLSEEDVVSILKNKAFANKNMDGGMERLCEEISKKLGGSPLAATTVGSLLNVNFDREYWKCIATSDEIGRLQEKDEHGIISILGLSYKRLPPHLKECFAYCSVFPKDYKFVRQQLILSWMAQGLVKPGDPQMQSLEWWGNKHFDDLLSLSLFEHYGSPFWGNEYIYVMHDLIHDLAVSVSQDHCVVVKGCQGRISEKIRHLSWFVDSPGDLLGYNSVHILNKCERLRTLRLQCSFTANQHSPMSHLDSFLHKVVCKKYLRRLRCLWLTIDCGVKRLPASISNLKHLRFLCLHSLHVEELPESLGDLCNLQTLIITYCRFLERLPKQVGGLTNLRHLIIRKAENLRELPGSLCRLTNLRHLEISGSRFLEYLPEDVSKLCNLEALVLDGCRSLKKLPDRIGCLTNLEILNVLECSNLIELPGSINQLANPSHIHARDEMLHRIYPGGMTALQQLCTGAHPRELKDLNELRRLRLGSLHLVTSREEASEAELHRKTHLTSLALCFDRNSHLTSFESGFDRNSHLTLLELCLDPIDYPYDRPTPEDADRDEGVLEGLQPYLAGIRELTIRYYRGVRWPRWMMDASTNQGFPSLEELEISGCPMLEGLPPLPPTLRTLCIRNCPKAEWASGGHLLSERKPFGGHLLLSASVLVDLTVGVVFRDHADDDDDAQVVSQLLAVCLGVLPSLHGLTISGLQRWTSVAQSKAATIVNPGMLLSPPGEELLQPLTSLRQLTINNSLLLTPFPVVEAYFSSSEPAKTAGDDIPYNNTTSAVAAGSSSSSLPSSSLSIIPTSPSSSHPPQNQMLMEKLVFDGIPSRMIKKLLRGMAPRCLQFRMCNELGFLGDEDCQGLDELEEALLALAPSLSHLEFFRCPNLRRLPRKLSCLFSLETLEILFCPELESLPEAGLPPTLQVLKIYACSEKLLERCLREAGADWHKISHIPKCEILKRLEPLSLKKD
ncbi:hypothetical protein Taro_037241 [Colocasia esculenta]|uniref:Uncharacterized protein n=1 Tax=Colocasia esculenta TaxID=4460 RepID=A0A843WAK9_COLES|nr:hypothetical protein [Colocasia esculenta]